MGDNYQKLLIIQELEPIKDPPLIGETCRQVSLKRGSVVFSEHGSEGINFALFSKLTVPP